MIHRRAFLGGLGGLGIAAATSHAQAPVSHEQLFRAGLILPPGPAGRCDDRRIGGPVVRWDPTERRWRMWYYGRDATFPKDMAPPFGTGSIATASSTDGLNWTRIQGPLARGAVMVPSNEDAAFDSGHVGTGDVVRHGDEWIMAYFGGNQETATEAAPLFDGKGLVVRPGLARSTDGLRWQRMSGDAEGGAALSVHPGDVYAAFPSLVHDGDRWLMFYTSVDKGARYWRSRIATSTDARHWTVLPDLRWEEEPALFETGGVITRDIQRNPFAEDPPWLMVYTAKDGRAETKGRRSIGLAVSEDLMTWRKLSREPIFTVGRDGAWDHSGVAVPRLIVTDTDVRLYYYGWSDGGFNAPAQRGIGCAVAPRDDPWRLRRHTA